MTARPNLVLLVVAGLVLVLLVVAGLAADTRDAPELDRATPHGTVQPFLRAGLGGGDGEVVALLAPARGCPAPLEIYVGDAARVGVVSVAVRGDTATVVVEITEQSGVGVLDSWTHRESYRLTRDGDWLITGDPWPVFSCEYQKVVN